MRTIDERYLLVGPVTWSLYQMFKPIKWLRKSPRWVWALCAPYILLFLLLDVLYNILIGSFLFWELPREWLFTHRLKRHRAAENFTSEMVVACRLCGMLNRYDPGHC